MGVDPAEVLKFDAMAARAWDPAGPFAPLHAMTPVRMDYILDQVEVTLGGVAGRRVLDVGCGPGLACEPLARLGAEVTGIDASAEGIAAARAHAGDLPIDYRVGSAEALEGVWDVVLALEVVEHVPDRAAFVATLGRLAAPGGLVILTTLNRTAASFALAIVAAERVLRWLPPGTHDWRKLVRPEELEADLGAAGLLPVDRTGFVLAPLTGQWRRSADCAVNYAVTAQRP